MKRRSAACLFALLFTAAIAAPHAAGETPRLKSISTPSRFVDPADVAFNGSDHPGELRAKVMLPPGYNGRRRFPVLFLLHGVGDSFRSWSDPKRGNVLEIARDLGAIVVMPEAARGFYTDWWNEGRRGEPGWESFYLTELVPLVERRFEIRRGRRWHAVAGISMGGLGAGYLASRLPGYFGSAASFSGFVQHQRPEIGLGIQLIARVAYEDIFGPMNGFYAAGHNPTRIAANLRHTRLFVAVGNGIAEPGVESSPLALTAGGAVELELWQQAEEFVAAARRAGAAVTYRTGLGVHDWPYWRRHLNAAIDWGLFAPVGSRPRSWTYRTVARHGRAWNLRFRFADPPQAMITLRREGNRLFASGSGRVEIRTRAGCGFKATLPFDRAMPRHRCAAAAK